MAITLLIPLLLCAALWSAASAPPPPASHDVAPPPPTSTGGDVLPLVEEGTDLLWSVISLPPPEDGNSAKKRVLSWLGAILVLSTVMILAAGYKKIRTPNAMVEKPTPTRRQAKRSKNWLKRITEKLKELNIYADRRIGRCGKVLLACSVAFVIILYLVVFQKLYELFLSPWKGKFTVVE